MFDEGKIVIIGASNVGTAVLNKIVDFGLASEVVLIDINEKKCMGESLDTSHATACISSHNIYIHEGDYEDCKDASMIIITAGPSIKPGETPDRLILTKTNCKIMDNVMSQIVRYTKDAIILVVTNPLDVATYYVSANFDYPREKIIGTGTLLETFRLRRILADYYHLDPKLVHGYVLGEHGNSGFVAWSTVDIASLGLGNMDEFFNRDYKLNKGMIEQKIMQVVYDVINLKGCTNTGIAMVACRFIKAIKYLDDLKIISPAALLNVSLKRIAYRLNKGYDKKPIRDLDKIYIISIYNGKVIPICPKDIKNLNHFAWFRSAYDAEFARNCVIDLIETMFGKDDQPKD